MLNVDAFIGCAEANAFSQLRNGFNDREIPEISTAEQRPEKMEPKQVVLDILTIDYEDELPPV